jgi:hypothetical protein
VTDPVPAIAVDAPARASAAFVVWCVVILVALGVVLGVLGAIVVPIKLRLLGAALPLAWAAALVNFTAGRLAQGALERWWAPALPFLGWAGVVGPMSFARPGGDKLFAYDDTSLVYVVIGVLAFMATIGTAATPAAPTGR